MEWLMFLEAFQKSRVSEVRSQDHDGFIALVDK
jgi:hypothetical protein